MQTNQSEAIPILPPPSLSSCTSGYSPVLHHPGARAQTTRDHHNYSKCLFLNFFKFAYPSPPFLPTESTTRVLGRVHPSPLLPRDWPCYFPMWLCVACWAPSWELQAMNFFQRHLSPCLLLYHTWLNPRHISRQSHLPRLYPSTRYGQRISKTLVR